jgi:hypothetical protein
MRQHTSRVTTAAVICDSLYKCWFGPGGRLETRRASAEYHSSGMPETENFQSPKQGVIG